MSYELGEVPAGTLDDDLPLVWTSESNGWDSDTASEAAELPVTTSEVTGLDEGPEADDRYAGYAYQLKSRDARFGTTKVTSKARSAESEFTSRMERILGVPASVIPEIFSSKPQKAVRTNPLRLDQDMSPAEHDEALAEELAARDIETKALDWFPGAFVFDSYRTTDVQETPLVTRGGAFIQNPSSILPVLALDPKHGERILDMCSAPGGKASLIGALTGNEAHLTVNEPKGRRMQRLRQVLETLGVEPDEYLDSDGRLLDGVLGAGTFDRVLVDAECSTEAGINFERKKPLDGWSTERIKRISLVQKKLAVVAFDLLKAGGTMVYSTCTLSPEENEAVITHLLERRSEAVVQPVTFRAEDTVPAIRSWKGMRYPKEVHERVLRVRPGNVMESFFVARIRKPGGDVDASTLEQEVSLDDIAKEGLYR